MSASDKVSFLLYNFNRDRESAGEGGEEKRNEGRHTESTRKTVVRGEGRRKKRTREYDESNAKHPLSLFFFHKPSPYPPGSLCCFCTPFSTL